MSKVLIDRDLLAKHVAQPAEAEGPGDWDWLKLAAEVAEEDGPWEPRLGLTDCETAFAQSASPTKVLELIAALSALSAERDAFREARNGLVEENGHLYGEIADLRHALTLCVASLDQLLPYLAKVPADVGLLNDALMAARPLLEERT